MKYLSTQLTRSYFVFFHFFRFASLFFGIVLRGKRDIESSDVILTYSHLLSLTFTHSHLPHSIYLFLTWHCFFLVAFIFCFFFFIILFLVLFFCFFSFFSALVLVVCCCFYKIVSTSKILFSVI